MRAILVDDESLALRDLERQLTKIGGLDIVGTFSLASSALEAAERLQPDVAFLDIEMPGISGLDTAELLLNVCPRTEVVFVTAYQEYAIKAFELHALDYVLKPLQPERLAMTVQRLLATGRPAAAAVAPAKAVVRCFQSMQIDNGTSEPFPWRTTKTQELFAYLLLRRQQYVRKDTLIDLLWPDVDPKKAYTQLYTTIYRLRKSLEAAGLSIRILNSGNGYSLTLGDSELDVDVWERNAPKPEWMTPDRAEEYQSWLEQYRGDYLEEHDYDWAVHERERLRSIWYYQAMHLGKLWEECGNTEAALQWYQKVLLRFPTSEEVYFSLMKLNDRMKQRGFVEQLYVRLRDMLAEELGSEPSDHVESWYADWKSVSGV